MRGRRGGGTGGPNPARPQKRQINPRVAPQKIKHLFRAHLWAGGNNPNLAKRVSGEPRVYGFPHLSPQHGESGGPGRSSIGKTWGGAQGDGIGGGGGRELRHLKGLSHRAGGGEGKTRFFHYIESGHRDEKKVYQKLGVFLAVGGAHGRAAPFMRSQGNFLERGEGPRGASGGTGWGDQTPGEIKDGGTAKGTNQTGGSGQGGGSGGLCRKHLIHFRGNGGSRGSNNESCGTVGGRLASHPWQGGAAIRGPVRGGHIF